MDELVGKSNLDIKFSYFLIEDVFYNDMWDLDVKDYFQFILQWVVELWEVMEWWNRDFGSNFWVVIFVIYFEIDEFFDFCFSVMECICFCELQLWVGVQYLYCYQGDCKYKVVI